MGGPEQELNDIKYNYPVYRRFKHSIKSDIFIQSRLNTRPVSLSLQQEPGVLSALVISVIGQCGPR